MPVGARCFAPAIGHVRHASQVLEISNIQSTNDFIISYTIKNINLEFGKNGGNASVWARGPGRNAPEASAGLPLGPKDRGPFPQEEAGGIFPALATEISPPYDSKRSGLAPGPWNHLALTNLFFQRTKKVSNVLKNLNSSFFPICVNLRKSASQVFYSLRRNRDSACSISLSRYSGRGLEAEALRISSPQGSAK